MGSPAGPPPGEASAADASGRDAEGRDVSGRDAEGRDVSGRDAEGRDVSGRDAEGREVERDIQALLADAEAKKDEYLELAKRTQADFENYRKRMAAEVQAASLRGKSEMARELIEAVDNLERALESAGENADGLAGGVEMVLRGMREALTRNRIETVDPQGERFDPTLHEALSTMPVEGTEPGRVVEVMQKGYRMDEQLLRPARVVVSA